MRLRNRLGYFKFLAFSRETSSDCAVAVYQDITTPKLNGDRYGYCRLKKDSLEVEEYREKESFTGDPRQECASCGLYYFRRGEILISKSQEILETDFH